MSDEHKAMVRQKLNAESNRRLKMRGYKKVCEVNEPIFIKFEHKPITLNFD